MNTKRTAAKTAPVTTVAVLTLLGTLFSSPATAAPRQGDFTATGVKIHISYSTTSLARGHGNPGDGYTRTAASRITGRTSTTTAPESRATSPTASSGSHLTTAERLVDSSEIRDESVTALGECRTRRSGSR
ncbi:hypothetical protein AB0E81_39155 [Streptomyces sp. NPDC033538]|uniref:hypothetical protein n=1 Tax=Streptomyces sp. NPDC033538 TaxID=3155367 RepID=UPI003402DAF8